MSQARITLRPPPNVDFVEGYPGIPAGPDRPHAQVRGTIEVRLPDQGAKTKWVRVELRKVETLPGGGQPNKFDDFIGQSPVKVWDAEGDWSLLHKDDFTFAIRIPESIPPTIKLDKGAGIRYELTATLCLKGKSCFFKKKDTILSTTHPIIIDKHELHSTWPVYAQPESRHVVGDLLMLTVDRSRTCYGPGDMVKVLATFKNDGIPAAALRGFELLLKETIIYRAGSHASGKKRAPQVHVTPIGEQKINENMTIYQGQQHQTELGCFIPQTHTNTTVVAARHIDISYKIEVKAVLGTGKPLIMELPVTVSNWPRNMSIEAVRRIGPAPNLSLISPINITHPMIPATIEATRPTIQQQTTQQSTYNTVPVRSGLFPPQNQLANERLASQTISATSSQYGDPVTGPRSNYDEFGLSAVAGPSHSAVPRGASPAIVAEHSGTGMRHPPVNTNPSRRLTLTNAEVESDPDSPPSALPASRQNDTTSDDRRRVAAGAVSGPSAPAVNGRPSPSRTTAPQRSAWPTAEEEKQRLYNQAREQALRTQASMGYKPSMPEGPEPLTRQDSTRTPPPMPIPEPAPPPVTKPIEPKKSTPWPTAEEEKLRLYQEAERARLRTQAQVLSDEYVSGGSGVNGGSPPARSYSIERPELTHKANLSSSSVSHDGAVYPPIKPTQAMETKSTGVQLYQHAIASMNRKPSLQASPQAVDPPSPPPPKPGSSQRSYPTAEEEKAALRYYEAKRAVDRHQQANAMTPLHIPSSPPPTEGPIAYEDLYPAGVSSAQAGSSYAVNGRVSDVSNGDNVPPPPISPPLASSSMFESAMSEKERLRRKYEAEDAAASAAVASPPTPPSRASGSRSSLPGYGTPPRSARSQPLPPADYSGPRFMTAAEEKARLRAMMEAEEAAEGGAASGSNAVAGPSRPSAPATRKPSLSLSYAHHERIEEEEDLPPPPPPPLAPRPPAEYIEETKEEDLRSQAEHRDVLPAVISELSMSSSSASDQAAGPGAGATTTMTTGVDFGLPFRPFSPLDLNVNFDSVGTRRAPSVPPPPSLPPKVPVSQ